MKKNSILLLTGCLLLQLVGYANSTLCESGWLSYGNSCYKVVHQRVVWHDAENICNKIHTGHLTAIYTAQHQALINCLISNSTDVFWIGLKWKPRGKPRWSTGLKVTFDKRYSKNAKNNQVDKCYTIMNKAQGTWISVNCSSHHYFICQYSSLDSNGQESSGLWQSIIGKVLSSLGTLRSWFLNDKLSPMSSASTECIAKSLQVSGDGKASNTPGLSRTRKGDHRAKKDVQSPKKEDKYYTLSSISTEQIPPWHYNLRTARPKILSSSKKAQISSQHSKITSKLISTQGSKTTIPTKISQATKIVSLLTTGKGEVMSGNGSRSEERTSSVVSSTSSIPIPKNYTKTNTTSSHDTSPPVMLTATFRKYLQSVSTPITIDASNQATSSQTTTVDLRLTGTSSSRPVTLLQGIQKHKNENHYNLTPILAKVSNGGKEQTKFSTITEKSTATTPVKRELTTYVSLTSAETSLSDNETVSASKTSDTPTDASTSLSPIYTRSRTTSTTESSTKATGDIFSVTSPSKISLLTSSTPIGVKYLPSEPNARYKDVSKQPIILNLLTTISIYLKKPSTPSSRPTIYSPDVHKHKKGHRYNLTPIISHISPNSTPWSNHHQSPIFHHIFPKLNNASFKFNDNTSSMIHATIHNISWSDGIIASLKKKLSGKKLQKRVKELIKKTLRRHLEHSTMDNSELPPIDAQNMMFKPRLVNFGDFFKIVDYFVNICHNAEWKKNELEGIVKEIAQNTDPFLKSSLSRRKLERYTKTLNYVDIEVMHVGVSHVGNVNCHGKNGKWKVGKLKLLSKTKINETISISMILLNTPAISILNSTNRNGDGSSFLVSPLLSIVAFGDQHQLQVSHTFSLEINRNVTNNANTTEAGNDKEEYDFSCVYLDIATGLWSDFGCEVTEEGITQISCFCNHTTNFAILMQVRDFQVSKKEELTLSTISYIGCSISLITQFITIAVFTFIEILRCERTFVHRNLCLAIVGAQITFLAGIKAVKYKIACSMIALVLHYCYMSVFAWMLVEGLHLYNRVVRVFGSELYRKIYYSVFGWGMPVLLIVISAAADWDGYGTDKVCWLSISRDTIWAFVGPALAIITVNIVILVCVTRIVMTSAKHGKQGQFDHVRAGVKGTLFLIPILGMTWVFGLLSVNRNLIIFQYLFAVSNSLQGFFIFLFHVVLNSEVRQALMRLRERRSLQRADLSSITSTSSSTNWNTKSISERPPRRWSRRVSPAQTGTSGTMSTV